MTPGLPPLNVQFLEQAVRKLAADSPDTLYCKPDDSIFCSYSKGACTNGSVGCIMGQALVRCGLGTTLALAQKWGSINNFVLFITNTDLEKLPTPVVLTIRWLQEVQTQQDQGRTWRDAVALADRFNQ